MTMRTTEAQHNTPEQVSEYLQTAIAIVDASDIPPDLVPAVLPEVLRLVASKQVFYEQIGPLAGVPGLNGP